MRAKVAKLAKKWDGFHCGGGEFKFQGIRAEERMRAFIMGVLALGLFPCEDWLLWSVLVVV